MDYEGRLREDLEATITEHRGEAGAAKLAEELLERDRGPTYLIGLQHNCTRARYYCQAFGGITDHPSTTGRIDDARSEAEHARFRDDVYAFVVDEAWSWLHPRYRWLVAEPPAPVSED